MNLRIEYENLLIGLGVEQQVAKSEWEFLVECYLDKRKYHNINHIKKVFILLKPHFEKMVNPEAIKLAIFYHDIVYVVGSKRNEFESAQVFDVRLGEYLDYTLVNEVVSAILSTDYSTEQQRVSNDVQMLLDADYASGLVGTTEEFLETNQMIIDEYSSVYGDAANKGRQEFLKDLYGKQVLKSEEFKGMNETIDNNISQYLNLAV